MNTTTQFDAAAAVRIVVIARDELAKLKKEYDAKKAEWQQRKDMLEGALLEYLAQQNAESIRTTEGTFFKSVDHTASLDDPEAFVGFIRATGRLELFERRASMTAVKAFIEENKEPPPGAKLSSRATVCVNRVPGKEYSL